MPSLIPIFLQKTFDILECCTTEIAQWSNNGSALVVKQIKSFETTVLPRYFRHKQFKSFKRPLRFYGFCMCKKYAIGLSNKISSNLDSSSNEDINGSSSFGQEWWEFTHP